MTQPSLTRMEHQDPDFENLDRDRIQRMLGNVSFDKAFFFYEDVGKPTGDFAVSLSDFCHKINTVAFKSLAFHLKRGDFENWIREALGDTELSQKINKVKTGKTTWKRSTTLQKKLKATVEDRLNELRDQWHYSLKLPPP